MTIIRLIINKTAACSGFFWKVDGQGIPGYDQCVVEKVEYLEFIVHHLDTSRDCTEEHRDNGEADPECNSVSVENLQ